MKIQIKKLRGEEEMEGKLEQRLKKKAEENQKELWTAWLRHGEQED